MTSLLDSLDLSLEESLLYGVLGLSALFSLGYLIPIPISAANIRSALSAMAGAQASVLAIVVSVTLISVQLVATRYAPRMATLPFQTPLFKTTFLLFLASIIVDLVLLLTLPTSQGGFYMGAIFVAFGIFLSTLIFLYLFVRGMVEMSTPENLALLFIEALTPEKYLNKVREYESQPEQTAHPLQPLFRFVMSALSQQEYTAAKSALSQYGGYTQNLLEEFHSRDIFDNNAKFERELFGPVLKEHLHEISIHAAEAEDSTILKSAVDFQVEIGKQSMGEPSGRIVSGQALSGLRQTIIDTPVKPEDYVTFNTIWPAVGNLILAEADYDQNRVLLSAKNLLGNRLQYSLNRSDEIGWHSDALRKLFSDLCDSHQKSVQRAADNDSFSTVEPKDEQRIGGSSPPTQIETINYSTEAILSITNVALETRISEEEYPITEGSFRRLWKELCIKCAEIGATEHAVFLTRVLLEVAVIENLSRPYEPDQRTSEILGDIGNTDSLYWNRELAEIREETEDPIVERAFNRLLPYQYKEEPAPILFANQPSDAREEYYFTELSVNDFRTLNTHREFPDLVQKLRDQSTA